MGKFAGGFGQSFAKGTRLNRAETRANTGLDQQQQQLDQGKEQERRKQMDTLRKNTIAQMDTIKKTYSNLMTVSKARIDETKDPVKKEQMRIDLEKQAEPFKKSLMKVSKLGNSEQLQLGIPNEIDIEAFFEIEKKRLSPNEQAAAKARDAGLKKGAEESAKLEAREGELQSEIGKRIGDRLTLVAEHGENSEAIKLFDKLSAKKESTNTSEKNFQLRRRKDALNILDNLFERTEDFGFKNPEMKIPYMRAIDLMEEHIKPENVSPSDAATAVAHIVLEDFFVKERIRKLRKDRLSDEDIIQDLIADGYDPEEFGFEVKKEGEKTTKPKSFLDKVKDLF